MTQQDDFNQPAEAGGYFEAKNAVGHLILITKVHEVYHNPSNVFGGKPQPRDEAKVDLVDLEADPWGGTPELRERIIVTHPGLTNRLVTGATNVLGRVGQVPTDKGNPAFVLNGHEPADVDIARRWVQQWQSGQFSAPQGAPQATGQAQVAPQPQAPATQPQTAPQAPQAAQPNPAAAAALAAMPPDALQALLAQLGGTVQQQPNTDPPF